jgi:cytochrome c oxidase cbb3-type subunit 3
MSSRCRHVLSAFAACCLAASLVACEREERDSRGPTAPETGPDVGSIVLSDLYAGPARPPDPDLRRKQYQENAFHLSEGKRLFTWFNCSGCHANGGGNIGPPLMDDKWIYGSDLENIFATIVQGRPNGMPSFRNVIPEQQVWQIAAYVRSMSGQAPKAASPSRSDRINSKPAEQSMPKEPTTNTDPHSPSLEGRQ